MKTLPLFCFLSLLAGTGLTAKEKVTYDDLLLEDGTVLKKVQVLKVEPDGLRLEHKNGVSKVKFEQLPEMVQKEFAFDRQKAEEFRHAQETARENKAAEERKVRVEQILQQRHEEQDNDLQRAREAFYKVVEADEYSYPQLDKTLLDSIAIFNEAGRKDLATLLEDDRKLLRERELVRPGEKYRREREQLLDRIQMLENQVAGQINNPPVAVVETEFVPYWIDRPVIVSPPLVVDPGCPPASRPVVGPPRVNPGGTPRSSLPVAPSRPSTPVNLPSSGGQVQGSHLWKSKQTN